jgi:Fur family ferric uptake transcriptional regulator
MASNSVRERILSAGQRITPQRDVIAGILEQAGRPLSAQELCDEVDSQQAGIGRATVFRTLQSLQEAGVVQRITMPGDQSGYLLCPTQGHHHHLVCRICGKVEELPENEVSSFLARIDADHGFETDHATFDIYGTCSDCLGGRQAAGGDAPGQPDAPDLPEDPDLPGDPAPPGDRSEPRSDDPDPPGEERSLS